MRNSISVRGFSRSCHWIMALSLTLFPVSMVTAKPALADPIVPAQDGTGTIVTPQGNEFQITGGSLSGDTANLFHSFEQFGLDSNQIANFLANPQIRNILGRVVGGDPSIIQGLIRVSNGDANLFLLNPSGFVFGPNAQLDVPGNFTATTANGIQIGDAWFNALGSNDYGVLNGDPTGFGFTTTNPGAIVNAGNLSLAPGQVLTLLAGSVANTGELSASEGQIIIASMPEPGVVRLSQPGQVLSLEVEVGIPADAPADWSLPIAQLPELLNLTQDYDLGFTLKPDGTVELTIAEIPVPTEVGTTIVSGSLDVSGPTGGTVALLGDTVGVLNAEINASGLTQGGQVRIGGDYQGQSNLPTSDITVVNQGSTIAANALDNGNGGQVIVWSDGTTRFSGDISAQGGINGGNGGFVEVSGLENLALNGSIDVSAPQGADGTILLDPQDIIIEPNDGVTEDNAQVSDGQILSGDGGTATDFTIDDTALTALTGNVLLQASRDIIAQSGTNLFFFNQGNGESVTFTAGRNITLNSNLFTFGASVALTANGGNITTNRISTFGGDISLNASGNIALQLAAGSGSTPVLDSSSFSSSAGNITLTSGGTIDTSAADAVIFDSLNSFGGDQALTIDSSSETGSGGNVSLTAAGDLTIGGISSGSSSSSGNGGNISLTSTGGNINATVSNVPVQVDLANGQATTGLLNSGANNGNGGTISLTAPGNITVGGVISGTDGSGTGGDISIQSTGGSVNAISTVTFQGTSTSQSAEAGLIVSGSSSGAGGNVTITAPGGIRTGIVATGSAGSGTGGNINLTSTGGAINTTMSLSNVSSSLLQDFGLSANLANLLSQASVNLGVLTTTSYEGNSGAVTLNAAGNIQTGSIITAALDGNAGSVSLTSSGGAIDTSFDQLLSGTSTELWQALAQEYGINTVETPSGNTLTASEAASLLDSATARPGILAFSDNGTGGTVTLSASGDITTSNIVTASIDGTGGNISLTSSNGAIDGSAGVLFENVSASLVENLGFSADAGRVVEFFSDPSVAFGGYITLSINGNAGNISLNAANSITTNYLTASSFSGQGGNISVRSSNGSVTIGRVISNVANGIAPTNLVQDSSNSDLERLVEIISRGNLNSSGSSGGDILVKADDDITAAAVNSSGSSGDGGDVTIDPDNITLTHINAQGGASGRGGNVTISTGSSLRITGGFVDRNGILASISTAGGLGGGNIDITFTGFGQIPFIIGDASRNGTFGAITTGDFTIAPGDDLANIFFTTRLGNIAIKTFGPEDVTGCALDPDDCTTPVIPPFSVNPVTAANLDEARDILADIEAATGVKPALIYANFVPDRLPNLSDFDVKFADLENGSTGEFEDYLNVPRLANDRPLAFTPQPTDQLELVVVTAREEPVIERVEAATRNRTTTVLEDLRGNLVNTRTDFLPQAQQLYQWFISPLTEVLEAQEIDNLVFILGDDLRLLPIASLYDGNQYLIENYSVGLMPSLALTDTRYVDVRALQLLAMGAENFVDQNSLPAVPVELSIVTNLWQSPPPLLNEAFTPENLLQNRQQAGIVHLATHGEFNPGDLDASYIQFSDRKVGLDELRTLRLNHPSTELMVLSACRTAVGSPEVELGFAGLAHQAGAKSALGSLWYVGDANTLALMTSFYENLRQAPIKAEALRQAQLALLRGDIRFENGELVSSQGEYPLPQDLGTTLESQIDLRHPYAWAAFTMIGSPW